MKNCYLTDNPKTTQKIGKSLAGEVFKKPPKKGALVLCLVGELGGGKTTFLQGFARGLKIKEKILSPTFIILKRFEISCFGLQSFYHIDCYRVEKPKEILDLDFKRIISSPKNIIAIEWADRIKEIIPKHAMQIEFKFIDKNKRKILIK